VYAVVREIVKPVTEFSGVSYALSLNPEGLQVRHFVTHAWAEGIKAFAAALRQAHVCGGLWICFLANPQTWEPEALSQLLGSNPYMSPFYAALRESIDVIAVRNTRQDMYTRLWCVFELWAATDLLDKDVLVVGMMPRTVDPDLCGFNATCFKEKDTKMLRSAISAKSSPDEVNAYVGSVIFQRPGTVLSSGRSFRHPQSGCASNNEVAPEPEEQCSLALTTLPADTGECTADVLPQLLTALQSTRGAIGKSGVIQAPSGDGSPRIFSSYV